MSDKTLSETLIESAGFIIDLARAVFGMREDVAAALARLVIEHKDRDDYWFAQIEAYGVFSSLCGYESTPETVDHDLYRLALKTYDTILGHATSNSVSTQFTEADLPPDWVN